MPRSGTADKATDANLLNQLITTGGVMKICTVCRRSWGDDFRVCPIDGLPLQDAEAATGAAGDPYIGKTLGNCRVVEKIAEIDWRDVGRDDRKISELEELKTEVAFNEISDSIKELVEIAREGLERTQRLVSDLKDFASPRRDPGGVVDLRRSVESTVQLIRYAMREKGITLHLDFADEIPNVRGDPRALNQVFLNLLKNAIESVAPETGNVWVACYPEDGRVIVRITDDGIGISLEHLDRLFDPFFSTKDAGKGTGLGLSISRRIISDHGGSIEVDSTCGEGATFIVVLPVGGARLEVGGATEA